jgi:hypothetical protein
MSMGSTKKYREPASPPATESNKVAESLSPFNITRAEARRGGAFPRKTKPPNIAGLPASEDVWRFAQENALVPHLETAVRLVRESFKRIKEIKLSYAPDPEIPHWESIVIDLHVTGDVDELQNAYTDYIHEFVKAVPNEDRRKINLLFWID